jgi:hypothetical protein
MSTRSRRKIGGKLRSKLVRRLSRNDRNCQAFDVFWQESLMCQNSSRY